MGKNKKKGGGANKPKAAESSEVDVIDNNDAQPTPSTETPTNGGTTVDDALEEVKESINEANGTTSNIETAADDGTEELKALVNKQKDEIERLKEQLKKSTAEESSDTEQIKSLKEQLMAAEQAKEESDDAYEELLGKISHIKATLGEKLRADSQELANAREELAKFAGKEKEQTDAIEMLKRELIQSTKDQDHLSHDLSRQRKELDDAYAKWQKEKDTLVKDKRELADGLLKERQIVEDLEVALREEKTNQSGFSSKVSELEDQVSTQASYAEQFRRQRDDLQAKLLESQKLFETKSLEFSGKLTELDTTNQETEGKLNAAQEQVASLGKQLQESQLEVERLKKFEKESHDKQLQIGKLRHEAVILNEHLTKALRMIKKDSEGEHVDKQLISNLFISFVQIPRGDSKKFEVLQLISNFLGWDEDQKAQAGLTRGSISGASPAPGIASPQRTFSSGSLADEGSAPGASGFMGLFAEFLERESRKGHQ